MVVTNRLFVVRGDDPLNNLSLFTRLGVEAIEMLLASRSSP